METSRILSVTHFISFNKYLLCVDSTHGSVLSARHFSKQDGGVFSLRELLFAGWEEWLRRAVTKQIGLFQLMCQVTGLILF